MNYLFPLDTYFAKPLSEFFTEQFAMPVMNKIHSGLAKVTEINLFNITCVTENVILIASRILFGKFMTEGVFTLMDYSITPILGDTYTSNRELIKTTHSFASWGVSILSLAKKYCSMQH